MVSLHKAVYHTTIYAFLIRSKDGAMMLCFVRRSLPIGEKKNIGSRQNIKISKSARFGIGSRFAEYAWFWDPTALWHLPALCPFCKHVVSSKYMNEVSKQNMNANGTVSIECPNCYNCFDHLLKSTRGDPRNIALIGHWDGWQPFSTSSKHSCGKFHVYLNTNMIMHFIHKIQLGSIEVSIATMRKSDRSKVDEAYVCGFVPSYLLPNKCPVSLDPFLEPLVTEVLDLFINGKVLLKFQMNLKIWHYRH